MAAKPRQPGNSPRKSLKQSLKDLFLRRLRKSPSPSVETVGSGILRKGVPSSSFISSVYTLDKSLPESTDSLWSLDQYTISRAIPNRFQTPTKRSESQNAARQSLLPATSLSQFNLHHAYLQQSAGPQRIVHQAISPTFTSLLSQEASIATFSPIPSASTLKLQDSRPSLMHRDSFNELPWPSPGRTIQQSQGRGKQVSWLDSATTSSITVPHQYQIPTLPVNIEGRAGVRQVEHFKSFCVLDTAMPGCPVVATSQELRYIFEIGEHFFLNSCECEGTSMDIVTGQDAAGDPVTHLVLFTPLVIPSSGRSRFMLASLVDVTRFIHDAASLPELEEVSNISTVESGPQTPLYKPTPMNWTSATYKLSAEDLLGGCLLPEDRDTRAIPTMESTDDIWVNLANEEKSRTSTARNTPKSTHRRGGTSRSSDVSQLSKTSCTVDEVLDDFMSSLQDLYSDFFLLGKSPLDDTYYEICNVSPMLYAAKDYVHGHLSRTGKQGIAELSTRLGLGSPFQAQVRWGLEGRDKRLYCSPLYGHNSTTWICFLVDPDTPELW
ncbi:hypothetical protein A1O3_03171 [Capronia epimyces CBS 606.96]|uniref:Uncharacterized protein n=1 Tax=Capronia epimyces CBS 606.96 TaxID=1182542 RepID=W9YB64_9EURO|nr:uncharacterized protein A1O3_03171 [Capronia epimyces CBS 606.96]EXJ90102.1 hypothetical protein A1O3_03171 [Capronia epimyces CBS 606.96]